MIWKNTRLIIFSVFVCATISQPYRVLKLFIHGNGIDIIYLIIFPRKKIIMIPHLIFCAVFNFSKINQVVLPLGIAAPVGLASLGVGALAQVLNQT